MQLYEALSQRVMQWRGQGYPHDAYPALAEILEWARQPDVPAPFGMLALDPHRVEWARMDQRARARKWGRGRRRGCRFQHVAVSFTSPARGV